MSERLKELLDRWSVDDPDLGEEITARLKKDRPAGRKRGGLADLELQQPQLASDAYEAIILEVGRPVFFVQKDSFRPSDATWGRRLKRAKRRLEEVIPSVGRVEVRNHPDYEWVGTGWLVADDVIATNRHVATVFGARSGHGFVFRELGGLATSSAIDFRAEHEQRATPVLLDVAEILFISEEDDYDVAFLRLAANGKRPVPLAQKAPEDRTVAAIGYPAWDGNRNPGPAMARIFADAYGVKRLAPGQLGPSQNGLLTHDCSTLGGNSGSVVVSLASGEAVGLHFSGRFHTSNYAVPAWEVARLLERARSAPRVRSTGNGMGELFLRIQRIEDRLGLLSASSGSAIIERRPVVEDYDDREGFDPAFLGRRREVRVPLPALRRWKDDVVRINGNGERAHLLDYTHFSVAMCKSRRLALYTAVNIDGRELHQIPRHSDRWNFDPRLDEEFQVGEDLYDRNPLDRGHLVRRLDPVWGSRRDASQANDDTFHFTNCSPQHKDLNQRTWNDLENYILDNAGAEELKVTVFTGPVFDENDREYRNIQVPNQFWKIAVIVDQATRQLSATGYLLSQAAKIKNLPEEFVYGAFRTYQVSLETLEGLTGLGFGDLRPFDPLEGRDESETMTRPILGPQDIVFSARPT